MDSFRYGGLLGSPYRPAYGRVGRHASARDGRVRLSLPHCATTGRNGLIILGSTSPPRPVTPGERLVAGVTAAECGSDREGWT